MTLSANRLVHGLGLVGVLCCGFAQATLVEDAVQLRAGTLACVGNHCLRVADDEQLRSIYVINHPNPDVTVALDRVRIFDAYGRVPCGCPNDEPPATGEPELGFPAGIIAARPPAGGRSTLPEPSGSVDSAISSARAVLAGSVRATVPDPRASAGHVSAWH